ncbi:DUF669 domain-containing protein [Lactobacillus sp. ESL0680]|uniref:DUF669 domain-containing protein n=1 Tax=Lactobacillus sp. ESL0680 TaxID=2983210 RepID=UPI0023F6DC41|nr:DUF669 domain-containing protein [Lactobacillus sp. ESL0680]WEV39253.1 DUF669 domain-containing protein [Lactobacillus sp. ESL0680]
MSFLNVDHKKAEDTNNLFPKGVYEMMTYEVKMDASKGGHQCMRFNFIVRKDLDKALPDTNAKGHGRHYWANVWTAKDENGDDSGQFKQSDLQNIAKAYGIPDGTEIKSEDDFMKMLVGKTIRIYINLGDHEYQGTKSKQNSTFTNSWQPTKFPLKGAPQDPFAGSGDTVDIDDNNLPF